MFTDCQLTVVTCLISFKRKHTHRKMKSKEESSPNEGRVRRKSSRNDQSPPRKQSIKSDELKQKSDVAKNLLKVPPPQVSSVFRK